MGGTVRMVPSTLICPRRNVLFTDGSLKILEESEFQELLQALRERFSRRGAKRKPEEGQ